MKRILILSVAFMAIFISCKKDPSSVNTPDVGGPKVSTTPVTGSVAGMITDENDDPLENAQVTIAGNIYTTNSKGIFKTGNITLDKYISTVKVSNPGYFTTVRSFSAGATLNYVNIKLIPKTIAGTFVSGNGGNISLSNGSGITFQANSINIKSSGTSYSGTVNVYVSYIDPTAQDIALTMPGGAIAENRDKQYVAHSMAIMAVEMESTSGEPLQLVSTKPASIKTLIPSALQSSAPETIDTWSLDERGVWMKETTASKTGNFYSAAVTHFSFWDFSIPVTPVFLTINIRNQDNLPLPNSIVALHTTNTELPYAYGFTDELGNMSGPVPANEPLEYWAGVYGLVCLTNQHTGNIGPYATDATENFVINIDPAWSVTISGNALDCNGNPVTDGTAEIYVDFSSNFGPGLFREVAVVNGSFNTYFPVCQGVGVNSFNIVVVDNNTMIQSATIPVTFANVINAGTINTCGVSSNEFINYTLDGTDYLISSSSATSNFTGYTPNWGGNPVTEISGGDNSIGNNLGLRIRGNTLGTFTVPPIDSIRVNGLWSLNLAGATATINTFPPVIGQFYEGSFDVPFVDAGINHTLTGTYRIKRDY